MPYRDEPLVTIATFMTVMEASLARGALEAIGIRALVPSELPGSFSRVRGAPLAAELQVFESDRPRAIVELRRLQIRLVEPDDEA
jgi:hypothetical protein